MTPEVALLTKILPAGNLRNCKLHDYTISDFTHPDPV